MSKYHNRKITIDGKTFDSLKEGRRYQELRLMERAGVIKDLQTQVPFKLIPAQKDETGKVIEKSVTYYADFAYWENGRYIVEDTKGAKTDVYKLKRKLMLVVHGIRIRET